MADIFKNIPREDIVVTKSTIHEYIPITGTILSGTYGTYPDDTNIKTYTHNMFESVYDYPYLSSSANHIFDVTLAVSADSEIYTTDITGSAYVSGNDAYATKKNQIYNTLAQTLIGYSEDGVPLIFDADGDHITTTTDKYYDIIPIMFSRLLVKDGIKKGSFDMELGMNPGFPDAAFSDYDWDATEPSSSIVKITDEHATSSCLSNSVVGDYAVLYASNYEGTTPLTSSILTGGEIKCGLIFYNPGIVILDAWLFETHDTDSGYGYLDGSTLSLSPFNKVRLFDDIAGAAGDEEDYYHIFDFLRGYEIEEDGDTDIPLTSFADALRGRIRNIEFSNNVEINSARYTCHVSHQDFNYSANPTYTSGSKILVKDVSEDEPRAYITSLGLYSADNELLAVAKLSQPIKKAPSEDFTLTARIDY